MGAELHNPWRQVARATEFCTVLWVFSMYMACHSSSAEYFKARNLCTPETGYSVTVFYLSTTFVSFTLRPI